MLDAVSAIAFEMQSSKGVFALLLGSGVSYSSKIPTGWAITIDLVRKVAALSNEDCGEKPEAWYQNKFGKEPDYSDLLDRLGSTPALRQEIIRGYIEPSAAERERAEKLPTPAHRAIADLMAKGYVGVVLTTNFDRLLEQALADLGIHPTVIAAAEHVAGAKPLVHAGPTVIKLHGDYLDTRIKNTSSELKGYAPEMNELLDRVLDEFGLIICGWSADWDVALKAAISRTPSRRYPMYFTALSGPSTAAQDLIHLRAGHLVPISGADAFFDGLNQKVNAIEIMRMPHPASAQLAVALMKEYIPDPKHQIRLHDLVANEIIQTTEAILTSDFPTTADVESDQTFVMQVKRYVSLLSTLMPMAYTAGLWATEDQLGQWLDTIVGFAKRAHNLGTGYMHLQQLQAFPATLLLYSIGLGAVVRNRHAILGRLLGTEVKLGRSEAGVALGDHLNVTTFIDNGEHLFKRIPEYSRSRTPESDLLADVLRPIARMELRDDDALELAFAKLELAMSVGFAERQGKDFSEWAPRGRFYYHRFAKQLLGAWETEATTDKTGSSLRLMAALKQEPNFERLYRIYGLRRS